MNPFVRGVGLIVGLELRQRVRGVAWYVLLGIFVVLVGAVTLLLWAATAGLGAGGWLFSLIAYFVLLLGTLVTPALSGNAINGERDAGTLATTQVTLITTGQLVVGKFLAAWISALAFLVVSLPFVGVAVALGELPLITVFTSALVLALELGVIAAIGVGLSGVISRPLFSVVSTYLVVAALSIGTLIAFGLLGAVTRTPTTVTTIAPVSYDERGNVTACRDPEISHHETPRFDLYWGILAANPYVVLADSAPPNFDDEHGVPLDMFTAISVGVRSVQQTPESEVINDYCNDSTVPQPYDETVRDVYDNAVPSWFVGLGIHLVLGVGALVWAWGRTSTPARKLPRGSRVA